MPYTYFAVKNITTSESGVQVEWYRFDLAIGGEAQTQTQTVTTITMQGDQVMSTSGPKVLNESTDAVQVYDVATKTLCAWQVKKLEGKSVFLRFESGKLRWKSAHQRQEKAWGMLLTNGNVINIKPPSVNTDLAQTCTTHQAFLVEQLKVLQASVAVMAAAAATETLIVPKILTKARVLTDVLQYEAQPLSLLTHLFAGAEALDFSVAIVYLLQRSVAVDAIVSSGLLADFLKNNLTELETIEEAYRYLQDIADQAAEPLKAQLGDLLTQAQSHGITPVAEQSSIIQLYALNGQVNKALSGRVPANAPMALNITPNQENWSALCTAFQNDFLQVALQLSEGQWPNIEAFFTATIQPWPVVELQAFFNDLQARPNSLQRFVTCMAPSAVQAWIQQNSPQRWLLLVARPNLVRQLTTDAIDQMMKSISVDTQSTNALWRLRFNSAFEPHKDVIALALSKFYFDSAIIDPFMINELVRYSAVLDWSKAKVYENVAALTTLIQQQAQPLTVDGYKNIMDYYVGHLTQHKLLAKWNGVKTPACLVNQAHLQAWIVLSLGEQNPQDFDITTCLNTIFHDFDLNYPDKEQQSIARRKVLYACITDAPVANPEFFNHLLAALRIGQAGGISAVELFAIFNASNRERVAALTELFAHPESFQHLLAALKIGQADGVSAEALLSALNTFHDDIKISRAQLDSITHYPESFEHLLTALKIGQDGGISAVALLTALNAPNIYCGTLMPAIAAKPESFQHLLTALKIGQAGGISAEALLTALNTPNGNGITPLHKLAENPASFQHLLTALTIGQGGGISATALLAEFRIPLDSITRYPKSFEHLLTALKIGQADGISAGTLLSALNTLNDDIKISRAQLNPITRYPESFEHLLTALKIGQGGGISAVALLTAFNTPNSYCGTLMPAIAANPASFQHLLTAFKIGQAGGISAEALLTALNTPNGNGITPLHKLAENTASFQHLLTALTIGQPNGVSIQQLLEIFTLERISGIGDRRSLFRVIAAEDKVSEQFLWALTFEQPITTKELEKVFFEEMMDGEKNPLQQIKQDCSGKYTHFIWLINALFPDSLPSSLKLSGILKYNLLEKDVASLSPEQKALFISREELDYLLTQEYPAHRNKAWHNSFWKRNDRDGSATIQQLKALMTDNPEQPAFNLMGIRAKLHRTSIGASKDSGTDFILNALMEKFNFAERLSQPNADGRPRVSPLQRIFAYNGRF